MVLDGSSPHGSTEPIYIERGDEGVRRVVLCFWLDNRVLHRPLTHPPVPQDASDWAVSARKAHSRRMEVLRCQAEALLTPDMKVNLALTADTALLVHYAVLHCAVQWKCTTVTGCTVPHWHTLAYKCIQTLENL